MPRRFDQEEIVSSTTGPGATGPHVQKNDVEPPLPQSNPERSRDLRLETTKF